MKFSSVSITGFGGIAGTVEVDLSADVVVLLGANGYGKSTICDSLTWCLTGAHPRGADPRSLYSRSGETQVSVTLREDTGAEWTVRRIVSDPESARGAKLTTSVVVLGLDEEPRDAEATAWLGRKLLPQPNREPDHYARALSDSFYLQQEQLREFLTRRTDDERFSTLSRMVGSGSLTDLVRAFESSKNVWSRAINKDAAESAPIQERLQSLQQACADLEDQLRESDATLASDDYRAWWAQTRAVLGMADDGADHVDPSLEGFATRVNSLQELRRSIARRFDLLASLLAEVESPLPPEVAPADGGEDVSELSGEIDRVRVASNAATQRIALLQGQIEQRRNGHEELQAMARLALSHVSDSCPLCGQPVEQQEFLDRLQRVLAETAQTDSAVAEMEEAAADRALLKARLEELEDHWVRAEQARDRQVQSRRARAAILERRRERELELSRVLGMEQPHDEANWGSLVAKDRAESGSAYEESTRLLALADVLRAGLDSQQSRRRLAAMHREREALEAEYAGIERDLESRRRTAAATDVLLQALRADAENFVTKRLDDIHPVLEQLYASIDPHPTFRSIKLATHNWYGKNRLSAILRDESQGVEVRDPEVTLSTSQSNALAVALFLAFNLGLRPTTLSSVVLDDPLQNLDDLHLLGLVDLLRRLSGRRQVIVTTHDVSFASLLTRKLRPIAEHERLSLIRITNWDRRGPDIVQDTMEPDPSPLKLAEA